MRRFAIFIMLVCLTCDDGDIITVDLTFDKQLEFCNNNTESFIIFDTKQDPSESLSLVYPINNDGIPYANPTPVGTPDVISINGSTNRFIYRVYNRVINTGSGNNANELCSIIPEGDLAITQNYEANAGTAELTVTIDDDDDDGIPSDLEGRGSPDDDGNFPDAEDFDGDGIPNYQDEDDDNDNVPTRLEIDTQNLDEDDDPTTNPLDTDTDGIPDYLDIDDDQDGVLTINEDEDGDKNPYNDTTINVEGIEVRRFLNPEVSDPFLSPGLQSINEYTRNVSISILIKNVDLEIITTTEIDFGVLEYSLTFTQELD